MEKKTMIEQYGEYIDSGGEMGIRNWLTDGRFDKALAGIPKMVPFDATMSIDEKNVVTWSWTDADGNAWEFTQAQPHTFLKS